MSNFRIPFAWGNTKNRDHVQWVIDDNTPIVAPGHGGTFILDNMMNIVWRVKTFHVTGSFASAGSFTPVGGTPQPWSMSNTLDVLWKRKYAGTSAGGVDFDVLDEQHLFGGFFDHRINRYPISNPYDLHDLGFGIHDNNPVSDHMDTPVFPDNPTVSGVYYSEPDTQLWFLPVELFGFTEYVYLPFDYSFSQMFPDGMGGHFTGTMDIFFDRSQYPNSSPGNLVFTMQGYTVTLALGSAYPFGTNSGFSVTSQSASVAITASEYFPFQDSQGNPVYDTVTGAQLHDPLG